MLFFLILLFDLARMRGSQGKSFCRKTAMLRLNFTDPETRTGATLEEGLPGINGSLKIVGRDQDENLACRWYFSEEGLRTLARSALALADQVRQTAQFEREKVAGRRS